jgi:hypothetical protein
MRIGPIAPNAAIISSQNDGVRIALSMLQSLDGWIESSVAIFESVPSGWSCNYDGFSRRK